MSDSDVPVKVVKVRSKRYLQLRWIDPETGEPRQTSSKTTRRREAEREAVLLEERMARGIYEERNLTWMSFRDRYQREHLRSLAKKSLSSWNTSANALERVSHPLRLVDVSSSMLSKFASTLREEKKKETSISTYLRTISVALNWAKDHDLILRVPNVTMPRRAKGVSQLMRSRPITKEEFERLQMTAPKVRKNDSARWMRFLSGLWESGLRISELANLSWDVGQEWSICDDFEIPMIKLFAEGEKGHQDRYQPITREFWDLISETAPADRNGPVFPMSHKHKGKIQQMTANHIGRIISKIGSRAGIITNARDGKNATSHDIGRRAFTTRIGDRLSQNELSTWMRHASPETTKKYYYAPQAQSLAKKLWAR